MNQTLNVTEPDQTPLGVTNPQDPLEILDAQITTALDALTERQRRFVLKFVETGNGAQAAREADYSIACDRSQAAENMAKPDIKQAITLLRCRAQLQSGIDAAFKRVKLLEIFHQAMAQVDFNNALKAIDLLNKMDGDYTPDTASLNVSVTLADQITEARKRVLLAQK